jgi:hypothetical protein
VSLNAATIEVLLAKGLTGADMLEIARAMENRADPTNAARQARHRAKKKAEHNGVTVTRDDKGSNDRDILTSKTPPIVISSEITPPPEKPELQPEHVVEVWNDLAVKHGLAAVKKITPERRKKLLTFIRRHTIDDITEAISRDTPFALPAGAEQPGLAGIVRLVPRTAKSHQAD